LIYPYISVYVILLKHYILGKIKFSVSIIFDCSYNVSSILPKTGCTFIKNKSMNKFLWFSFSISEKTLNDSKNISLVIIEV
jgi:hypothetical protein